MGKGEFERTRTKKGRMQGAPASLGRNYIAQIGETSNVERKAVDSISIHMQATRCPEDGDGGILQTQQASEHRRLLRTIGEYSAFH